MINLDLPAKKQQLKKQLNTGYHINHLETNAYHYSFLSPTRINNTCQHFGGVFTSHTRMWTRHFWVWIHTQKGTSQVPFWVKIHTQKGTSHFWVWIMPRTSGMKTYPERDCPLDVHFWKWTSRRFINCRDTATQHIILVYI